jgi:ATP-binding cassette, subfamily B, bacterial
MSTTKTILKIYWAENFKHKGLLLQANLLTVSHTLRHIIAPLFLANTVQNLYVGTFDMSNVFWLALIFASATALEYLGYIAMVKMDMRSHSSILQKNFDHLGQLDYSFHINKFAGSLVASSNRFASNFLIHNVTIFDMGIGMIVGVVLALSIMTIKAPVVGLTVLLVWLTCVMLVIYLAVKRAPIRREAAKYDSKATGELADTLTNIVTVKHYAANKFESSRYAKTLNLRKQYMLKSWFRGIKNETYMVGLSGVLQVVLLYMGISAVQSKTIDIATFVLFQIYMSKIIDSLFRVNQIVRALEGVLSDASEMAEIYQIDSGIKESASPKQLSPGPATIVFQNIFFDYDKKTSLFSDFSLGIPSGQRLGLVGPSGGGKSSLSRLLLRFHDVNAGAITINGTDIKDVLLNDLRRAIAYVPQEPLLFHRSLMENIRYGRFDATDNEVYEAARLAHATEFIDKLPGGYETLVGERGVKLSGGQRQRVAIARAMLSRAPILVLDEATSALDSESEKYIQQALTKLMEGRTTIVIAHRLSTIASLDRIVVLDNGAIVEEGTHAELLKKKTGSYSKLWSHQSGGFLGE